MHPFVSRREFLLKTGISAAAANFMLSLPSLGLASAVNQRRQRLVFIFSPNGVVPDHFWPEKTGADFELKRVKWDNTLTSGT